MTKKVDATYSDYHYAAEAAFEAALEEDKRHQEETPKLRLEEAVKVFLDSYDREMKQLREANA